MHIPGPATGHGICRDVSVLSMAVSKSYSVRPELNAPCRDEDDSGDKTENAVSHHFAIDKSDWGNP
jgi:hypothetical protein